MAMYQRNHRASVARLTRSSRSRGFQVLHGTAHLSHYTAFRFRQQPTESGRSDVALCMTDCSEPDAQGLAPCRHGMPWTCADGLATAWQVCSGHPISLVGDLDEEEGRKRNSRREYNNFYHGAGAVDFRGISVGAATLIVSLS